MKIIIIYVCARLSRVAPLLNPNELTAIECSHVCMGSFAFRKMIAFDCTASAMVSSFNFTCSPWKIYRFHFSQRRYNSLPFGSFIFVLFSDANWNVRANKCHFVCTNPSVQIILVSPTKYFWKVLNFAITANATIRNMKWAFIFSIRAQMCCIVKLEMWMMKRIMRVCFLWEHFFFW